MSLPPAYASTLTSGAVASGDCRYGMLPALELRLRRFPSSCWRHPSSCLRALSISRSSLSSAVTFPLTHIALFKHRSVFYPLAHFVALTVACLHSYVDCGSYATQMCLSPPLDASALVVQIPLACFSRGHRSVLRNPWGEIYLSPRAFGFLSLPLLGNGTCH